MKGTLVRGTLTRADRYTCARCGCVRKFNLRRGRPELCRDCVEVLQEIPHTLTEGGTP